MLVFDVTLPATTHIGDAAPALYITALPFERTGGIPLPTPAVAHPVPISSFAPVSARHEILLAGAPDPPPPPPQQIHAVPLYETELIRIPGSTFPPPVVEIALHPVAPVLSLVKYSAEVVPCDPPTTQNRLLDAIQTGWNDAEPPLAIPETAVHPIAPYLSVV